MPVVTHLLDPGKPAVSPQGGGEILSVFDRQEALCA